MLKILCLLGVLVHVRTIWGCAITGSIDALVKPMSISRGLTKGVIVVIFNDQFTTDIEYRPSLFLYGRIGGTVSSFNDRRTNCYCGFNNMAGTTYDLYEYPWIACDSDLWLSELDIEYVCNFGAICLEGNLPSKWSD